MRIAIRVLFGLAGVLGILGIVFFFDARGLSQLSAARDVGYVVLKNAEWMVLIVLSAMTGLTAFALLVLSAVVDSFAPTGASAATGSTESQSG